MGTKGKHNRLEASLGTKSSSVASKSGIPVLIVPENCSITLPMHVGLAIELKPELALLGKIRDDLLRPFGLKPFLVHIGIRETIYVSDYFQKVTWPTEQGAQEVTIVRDTSVVDGLNAFVDKWEIDIIGLIRPTRKVPDGLFHGRLSKALVIWSQKPVLVYPN